MSVPPEIVALAERRAAARAARDFAAADALRDELLAAGWAVTDGPDGWDLSPAGPAAPSGPSAAHDVARVLEEPATALASVHWVCEGWPEDIDRAIAAFRAHAPAGTTQYVVADVTGQAPDRWGEDVEVVGLEAGTGWGAARNAGLGRSGGDLVLAVDGSIEPTGDWFGPLAAALADGGVGVVGPFGIVTRDLRQFDEAPGPGPCDAVEGYLMAFRRATLTRVGGFDEKFRWYRTADIEWSFRVKDAGLRCEVVEVPVTKHEHRMWFETDPATRAKWSKRNFYRFLDRWRDRWDLVLAGPPRDHDHDDHDHGDDGREGPVTLPDGR
ncbi:MAG TPA: glycosyltransferase [Actinomycetota bacterium]|nr:glycosyltransferase [Actinomycetota bacterium]